MDFRVEVAPRALDELEAIAGYIGRRGSFEIAEKWAAGLADSLRALRSMPGRHLTVAASREVANDVYLSLHGSKNRTYKIFYVIDLASRIVRVFHIRHWARKMPTAAELHELASEPDKTPGSD
jgi:plasmid stabilization system protein ParE